MYTLRRRDLSGWKGGPEAASAVEPEECCSTMLGEQSAQFSQFSQSPKKCKRPGSAPGTHVGSTRKLMSSKPGKSLGATELTHLLRPPESEVAAAEIRHWGSEAEDLQRRVAELERQQRQNEMEQHALPQLRSKHQALTERVHRQTQNIRRLQDKMKQNADVMKRVMDSESARANHLCTAPCCTPVSRLEKAGLNISHVNDLKADWAGYVFGQVSSQVQSCGQSFREIFKKYEHTPGTLDESAFKAVIRHFLSDFKEDQLTRLFFFADGDGSGKFDFLEFLRIFGNDINGEMSEEYFEFVMTRIFKALEQNGGLLAVYRKRDRSQDGLLQRDEMIDLVYALGLGLTRREITCVFSRLDKNTDGSLDVHEVDNALRLCASARFVTEAWVVGLFEEIFSALQVEATSLHQALQPIMDQGYVTYEDLTVFVRRFKPGIKKTQIDRLFWFLDTERNGKVALDSFFEVACNPILGSTKNEASLSMPSEIMERFCSHLVAKCGNISQAFDQLDPFVHEESFEAALKELGFPPTTDFRRLFHFVDTNRNGKVQKKEFMQVLGRYIDKGEDGQKEAGSGDTIQEPASVSRYCIEPGNETPEELERWRKDYQRILNRLLVLENEFRLAKHRLARQQEKSVDTEGMVQHITDLEAANRGLLRKCCHEKTEETDGTTEIDTFMSFAEGVIGLPDDQDSLSLASVAFSRRGGGGGAGDASPRRGGGGGVVGLGGAVGRENSLALQSVAESIKRGAQGDSENLSATDSLMKRVEQLHAEKAQTSHCLTELVLHQAKVAEDQLEEVQITTGECSGPIIEVQRMPSATNDEPSEAVDVVTFFRLALRQFAQNSNQDELLDKVHGITLAGRFVIRDLLTVESDAVVFNCSDAFVRRDVAVKLPIYDNNLRVRYSFLRECCIYSILSGVPEIQGVFHFPGLTEPLLYCVMELLHGHLLVERFRGNHSKLKPPTYFEAAEICNALLHGVAEFHARGVVHLDIKPSVVWEVQQPAGVVVKILDFGMAQLKDSSQLAAEARLLLTKNDNGAELEDPELEVDLNEAPSWLEQVPDAGSQGWAEFARFACFPDIGSPWYMSPARWCDFVEQYETKIKAAQPLHWCDKSKGCGVKLTQAEEGGENDTAVVASPAEESNRIVCSSVAAPLFYEGVYFEVVLQKTWPLETLQGDLSSPDGPVGFALGFAQLPQGPQHLRLPERLRDLADCWVVGYDGRAFFSGNELKNVTSTLDSKQVTCENGDGDEGGNEEDDDEDSDALFGITARYSMGDFEVGLWPAPGRQPKPGPKAGPLGWSFAELTRNDRVGLLATLNGFLRVFVNETEKLSIQIDGLDISKDLYPVIEICGTAKQVLLEPFPLPPACASEQRSDLVLKQKTYQLSRHAADAYPDVYSCAFVACLCFSSIPKAPPRTFLQLLASAQSWIEEGRQALEMSSFLLNALWDWFDSDKSDVVKGLPDEVAKVVLDVLNARMHYEGMSAHDFREALNAETGWSHMSPEFMVSHLGALGIASLEIAANKKSERYHSQEHLDNKNEVCWDLTHWALSSSHIRRLNKILLKDAKENSHLGKRMHILKVLRFDPQIPTELLLTFISNLNGGLTPGALKPVGHDAKPNLQFGSTRLPVEECTIPFQELRDANAVSIVLRFVRRLNLSRGPEDPSSTPIGASGAAVIADAVYRNKVLQELNLRGQMIGKEGARVLGKAMISEAVLEQLDLSSNGLGEPGVRALSEALSEEDVALEVLNLAVNNVGDDGCYHLAAMLEENTVLRSLCLQRNGISSAGACALGTALVKNESLETLDVGRNGIDEEGIGSLARVGRNNSSLTELNFQDNGLDLLAADMIAEALAPPERNLLDSSAGAAVRTSENSRKRSIMMPSSMSEIKDQSADGFGKPQSALKSIRESMKMREEEPEVDLVAPSPAADRSRSKEVNADAPIKAQRRATITDPGLNDKVRKQSVVTANQIFRKQSTFGEMFPLWNSLRRLNLRRNHLGSEGAVRIFIALRNNNQMLAVNLAWNNLGKVAARVFADLFSAQSRCHVEEWDLRDNFLGDEGAIGLHLVQVAKAKKVLECPMASSTKWLSLANNRIDEQGVGYIAEAMPLFGGLEVLDLHSNSDLCNTRAGKWRSSAPTTDGLAGTAAVPNPGGSAKGGGGSNFELRGVFALAKALGQSLKVFNLGSCGIGGDGVAAIVRHFVGHPRLKELDLSDNGIGVGGTIGNHSKVEQVLCDMLRSTRKLKKLRLALNKLDDDMAIKLLKCLCTENHFLQILDLSLNDLSQALKTKVRNKVWEEQNLPPENHVVPSVSNGQILEPQESELETQGMFTAIYSIGGRVLI